ncbi:MAG: DUF3298 domain-containing protein [Candidatus Magasanikbacteria bacterium]
MYKIILVVVSLFILGFSCTSPIQYVQNGRQALNDWDYVQQHLVIKEQTIVETKEGSYDIEITYPTITEPAKEGTEGFNRFIEFLLKNNFLPEFKVRVGEAGPLLVADVPYSLSGSYEILESKLDYISVRLFFTEYLGGAHPVSWTYTIDYELDVRHLVDLGDIFNVKEDVYLPRLSELSQPLLVSQLDDMADLQWIEKGTKPVKSNFKNFNVTAEGLKFVFDPYQVAPYAAGMQEITIFYNQLEDLINKNGPVKYVRTAN